MVEVIKKGYTRVTDIVNPWSKYDSIPPRIIEPAKIRGTKVHEMIAQIYWGYYPLDDGEYAGYMESFEQFKEHNPITDVVIERRFYDDSEMITGAIDLIGKDKEGKWVMIDFKTSQSFQKSWPIQIAAYKRLTEANDIKCDKFMVVKLDKNGENPEIFCFEDMEKYIILFDRCLEMYKYFCGKGEE